MSTATTAPADVGQTETPSANEGPAPTSRRMGLSTTVWPSTWASCWDHSCCPVRRVQHDQADFGIQFGQDVQLAEQGQWRPQEESTGEFGFVEPRFAAHHPPQCPLAAEIQRHQLIERRRSVGIVSLPAEAARDKMKKRGIRRSKTEFVQQNRRPPRRCSPGRTGASYQSRWVSCIFLVVQLGAPRGLAAVHVGPLGRTGPTRDTPRRVCRSQSRSPADAQGNASSTTLLTTSGCNAGIAGRSSSTKPCIKSLSTRPSAGSPAVATSQRGLRKGMPGHGRVPRRVSPIECPLGRRSVAQDRRHRREATRRPGQPTTALAAFPGAASPHAAPFATRARASHATPVRPLRHAPPESSSRPVAPKVRVRRPLTPPVCRARVASRVPRPADALDPGAIGPRHGRFVSGEGVEVRRATSFNFSTSLLRTASASRA